MRLSLPDCLLGRDSAKLETTLFANGAKEWPQISSCPTLFRVINVKKLFLINDLMMIMDVKTEVIIKSTK